MAPLDGWKHDGQRLSSSVLDEFSRLPVNLCCTFFCKVAYLRTVRLIYFFLTQQNDTEKKRFLYTNDIEE